jgi:hypothetical protein
MIHEMTRHAPGTVILAQGQFPRFAEFEKCLDILRVPTGTQLARINTGCCALGCNIGVRNRVGDWVWFIDDDHTFEPDILLRLLEHNVDMVAPLVTDRRPPFDYVLYKHLGTTPEEPKIFRAIPYTVEELQDHRGLLSVQGLPKAGLLARNIVWETMRDPWFTAGRLFPDQIDDDRIFMWNARSKYGLTLWADLDQSLGHLTVCDVGVRRIDSRWTRYVSLNGAQMPLLSVSK